MHLTRDGLVLSFSILVLYLTSHLYLQLLFLTTFMNEYVLFSGCSSLTEQWFTSVV